MLARPWGEPSESLGAVLQSQVGAGAPDAAALDAADHLVLHSA